MAEKQAKHKTRDVSLICNLADVTPSNILVIYNRQCHPDGVIALGPGCVFDFYEREQSVPGKEQSSPGETSRKEKVWDVVD